MIATDDLRHEHDAVLRMLRVLEAVAVRPPAMDDVQPLQAALGFLRGFVDACHHHKEEELLVPALVNSGVSHAIEMAAQLLVEHDRGRELVALLGAHLDRASAGEPLALGGVGGLIGQYAKMLYAHIDFENNTVFPLADEVLSPAVQEDLAEGYERIEREVIGEGRHEEFHALLERLEAAYL
ncbi:MAG: hemerythrin domain-containing protein [Coriobacteriia bacterium]|nr:hemerythrin domain-containing protein [Coriobacteriia bacterium]